MHKACTIYALIFAVASLNACAHIMPPITPEFSITPDTFGLSVAPSGLRIDFGRAPEGVIALLDGNNGPHVVLGMENCPDGIIQNFRWGDLTLTFTDEQFVGWQENATSQGQICAG